jgi:hypothetical protein
MYTAFMLFANEIYQREWKIDEVVGLCYDRE